MAQTLSLKCVAGPGVEPGLEDYEPSVQPYTTPQVLDQVYWLIVLVV